MPATRTVAARWIVARTRRRSLPRKAIANEMRSSALRTGVTWPGLPSDEPVRTLLRHKHDLAARVSLLELPEGITHPLKRVRARDRYFELSVRDQSGQLRQHRGAGTDGVAVELDAEPRSREVGDRVNPAGGHPERQRELDVAAADRVDERVERAVGGCTDRPRRRRRRNPRGSRHARAANRGLARSRGRSPSRP